MRGFNNFMIPKLGFLVPAGCPLASLCAFINFPCILLYYPSIGYLKVYLVLIFYGSAVN